MEKKKLPPISEDCLTLNVFTPVWEPNDEEGFPVLVFIHGGAFLGDSCAKYGDVSVCEHIVCHPLNQKHDYPFLV